MTKVDWALLLILLSFMVNGAIQGLARQLFGLAGFCLGLVAAAALWHRFALNLAGPLPAAPLLLPSLAFTIIFLGIWALCGALGFIVSKQFSSTNSHWLDEATGALVGLLSGIALLVVLYWGATALGLDVGAQVRRSRLGVWFISLAQAIGHSLYSHSTPP